MNRAPQQCIEAGCTSPVKSRGLCHKHYQRRIEHGTLEMVRPYRQGASDRHLRAGPGMKCTCWCEREIVRVSDTDILNGRTKSCGHPDCHPPIAQAS